MDYCLYLLHMTVALAKARPTMFSIVTSSYASIVIVIHNYTVTWHLHKFIIYESYRHTYSILCPNTQSIML